MSSSSSRSGTSSSSASARPHQNQASILPPNFTLDPSLLVQSLRADGRPPRPMNAFILFGRWRRKDCKGQDFRSAGEMSAIVAEEWKALGVSDRAFFNSQADAIRTSFDLAHPSYVYTRSSKKEPNKTRGAGKKDPVSTASAVARGGRSTKVGKRVSRKKGMEAERELFEEMGSPVKAAVGASTQTFKNKQGVSLPPVYSAQQPASNEVSDPFQPPISPFSLATQLFPTPSTPLLSTLASESHYQSPGPPFQVHPSPTFSIDGHSFQSYHNYASSSSSTTPSNFPESFPDTPFFPPTYTNLSPVPSIPYAALSFPNFALYDFSSCYTDLDPDPTYLNPPYLDQYAHGQYIWGEDLGL